MSGYVAYWALSLNLNQDKNRGLHTVEAVRQFLAEHEGQWIADALRRDWLRALGRADQWSLFLQESNKLRTEDAEIDCHGWRYGLTEAGFDRLDEIRAAWNAGKPLPEVCYDTFALARSQKHSLAKGTDAWIRVRRLFAENQIADARRSAASIEGAPKDFERLSAQAVTNAARFAEKEKIAAKSPASVELFLFALTRLARTDAVKAAKILDARAAALATRDRAYAWAQVGLYGAMQHESDALSWFARAGAEPLTDTQAQWKTRAALRAGDWSVVKATIEAMSATERRDAAWRFWLARAHVALNEVQSAQPLREALARENNFYGLLAAEELGRLPTPMWQGWKPTDAALAAMQARDDVKRALALYRLELKSEGFREWQFAIRNLNDEELLTAAEVARRHNVPDRAINTADRTLVTHDFSQRFPTPHLDVLQTQSRLRALDEAWVYGLIRQESRFMADAKSRVGATGLMQLMPATARWAAKQSGVATAGGQNFADVPVNLSLGAYYLRHVLDDLGHPILATAAYNAGPGRARRWRADHALDAAIYAETIPFNETRDYVKKVMSNAWFYAHKMNKLGTPARSFKQMIGVVPGKNDRAGGASSLAALPAPNTAP